MVATRIDSIADDVASLKEEVDQQKLLIKEQNDIIAKLKEELQNIKGQLVTVQSDALLSQHVNSLLSRKIDDNEQYSRRNCIIIDGLDTEPTDSEEAIKVKVKDMLKEDLHVDDTIIDDIDRAHQIASFVDGKQSVIVKFNTFTSKKNVLKKRGQLPRSKFIKSSLTKRRKNLLGYTKHIISTCKYIKHAYADMNCQLKVVIEGSTGKNHHVSFNSYDELAIILAKNEYREITENPTYGQNYFTESFHEVAE